MDFLEKLFALIQERKTQAKEGSYTSELFASGIERMSQKVGEEGVETVIASVSRDKKAIVYEMADLWYHCLVLLAAHDLTPDDLLEELKQRHGKKKGTEGKA